MKALKWTVWLLVAYVGLVFAFESLLGTFQPAGEGTLVITTTDAEGITHERVVSRLTSGGQLYIAANHWPRAWYRRTLENPNVQVVLDGVSGDYLAVPVTGEEHGRVESDNRVGIVFRVLTGFPPRYFVRLDPL